MLPPKRSVDKFTLVTIISQPFPLGCYIHPTSTANFKTANGMLYAPHRDLEFQQKSYQAHNINKDRYNTDHVQVWPLF